MQWHADSRDLRGLSAVRRDVRGYIEQSVHEADVFDVEVVVGELLANAAQHAPGPLCLTVERRADAVAVLVSDRGNALRKQVVVEGLGLRLIASLADELRLMHGDNGLTAAARLAVRPRPSR